MNKTALRNSLITLGVEQPALRPAIRPVLAALGERGTKAGETLIQGLKSLRSWRYDNYPTKFKFDKPKYNPRDNKATVQGKIDVSNGELFFNIGLDISFEAIEGEDKGFIVINAHELGSPSSKGYGAKMCGALLCDAALKHALDLAVTSVVNQEMSLI